LRDFAVSGTRPIIMQFGLFRGSQLEADVLNLEKAFDNA
jgi:hypothetical protein